MATSPTAVSTPPATKETAPAETVELSPEEQRLCDAHKIIKNNMYWSMGVGLVPMPFVDLVGVAAFQLRMIKGLSDLYGIPFKAHCAKNIIGALVGSVGAGIIRGGLIGSMFKFVPGAGAIIGGMVAGPVVAGASTYAIGKVFVQHFESGGTFLDFDPEKTKAYFAAQFQEGKKLASEPKRSP